MATRQSAIILARYRDDLVRRSHAVPAFFDRNMGRIAAAWIAATALLALVKLGNPATPVHGPGDALPILLVYSAVIAAPVAGYLVARAAFSGAAGSRLPRFHLAFYGRWRPVERAHAQAHPLFGPAGFVASLLIGMVLNVVVRAGEFFAAVPAMSAHAPEWGMILFVTMGADVAVTGFFYMAAFVMALRTVPLFPRMLLYAWMVDVFMQLMTANRFAAAAEIPPAVAAPLIDLLEGNLTKVMIGMAVWLPYLLLSDRVNLTYRNRLPAG
jgi:hypothetical protein